MAQWQIKSNIEAFGYFEVARMLKKRKVSFAEAYFMIFGKLPLHA